MHAPVLPPEICDDICSQLADDPAALANCGQIHSSWIASARVHLFKTVVIDSSNDVEELKAIFCGPNSRAIMACIRELSLINDSKKSWSGIWKKPCAITQILTNLNQPNMWLDSLTISGLDYEALPQIGRATLQALASSTPVLHLHGINFGSINNLFALASSAPALHTLSVHECIQTFPKSPAYARHNAPPLMSVSMPSQVLRVIVAWNSYWHTVPTVTKVDLHGVADSALGSCETWYNVQQGLQHMVSGSNNSYGWYNPGQFYSSKSSLFFININSGFDAKNCLALRSITLHAGYIYVGNKVTHHLTSVISPALEEINLSVYNTGGYSAIPFPGIDIDELIPFLVDRPKVMMRMVIASSKHDMDVVYKTYNLKNSVDIRVALINSLSPEWNAFRPSFEDIFKGVWKPRSIVVIS